MDKEGARKDRARDGRKCSQGNGSSNVRIGDGINLLERQVERGQQKETGRQVEPSRM
jgi:hypothetical protein